MKHLLITVIPGLVRRLERRTGRLKTEPVDRNKSLQDIDGEDWGEPTYDSHLVKECHRLRRVPLCQFGVEDLRIMIGQHIGMEHLMPLAVEHLRADPLTEGAYYSGDLLAAALRTGKEFWQQHPDWKREVAAIAEHVAPFLSSNEALLEACASFRRDVSSA